MNSGIGKQVETKDLPVLKKADTPTVPTRPTHARRIPSHESSNFFGMGANWFSKSFSTGSSDIAAAWYRAVT